MTGWIVGFRGKGNMNTCSFLPCAVGWGDVSILLRQETLEDDQI